MAGRSCSPRRCSGTGGRAARALSVRPLGSSFPGTLSAGSAGMAEPNEKESGAGGGPSGAVRPAAADDSGPSETSDGGGAAAADGRVAGPDCGAAGAAGPDGGTAGADAGPNGEPGAALGEEVAAPPKLCRAAST